MRSISCAGTPSVIAITVCDAGVDRLVDGVGGERRRHEDHRRVRAVLRHGLGDGVEHRHALDVLPALARRDAGDEVRPVAAVAEAVEPALGPREALDDEPRLVVDEDRHQSPSIRPDRDLVERQPPVGDAVAEQLRARAPPPRPRTRCARAMRRSRTCARRTRRRRSRARPPRRSRATPPPCSCGRARDRAAPPPPRPRRPCGSCRRSGRDRG